jgi:cytochrome c peroxidase
MALLCVVGLTAPLLRGQTEPSLPAWLVAAWRQALSVSLLPAILEGSIPVTLPQTTTNLDGNGITTTYFPSGSVTTSSNPFFQSLGTNGRSCFTCHQPQNNWSITPVSILATYLLTAGKDPLFSPVDGADCPTTGAASPKAGLQFISARTELFTRGDIRISIPEPANPQWASVTVSSDPTGCERNPTYGLPAGMLSFYRRPLPATNVIYTTPGLLGGGPNIMWDTREPSLTSQFIDATLVHAQASSAPTATVAGEGVSFESGSFTAQTSDFIGSDLTGADSSGATGGPLNLYKYSNSIIYPGSPFAVFNGGVCAVPMLPCPGSLSPSTSITGDFNGTGLFAAFANSRTANPLVNARRESIARGEVIFNTRTFNITGVTGLNDVPGFGSPVVVGTCSRCHNNYNVGNDGFDDPKHIGIADNSYVSSIQASANGSTTLPTASDQPVFTFLCPVGSITYFSNPVVVNGVTYDKYQTSDPGVGWITGQCADLGKFKVSSLRGVGARPPFFHGGQAANMTDVVVFYNNRFSIGLSSQDIQDLVNYLNAL